MPEEKLPVAVHEQFARTVDEKFKRQEDENERQNKRIQALENMLDKIYEISASVDRLVISLDTMTKELQNQGARLEAIEREPGDKWKNMTWYILTAIVGAIIGAIASKFGV